MNAATTKMSKGLRPTLIVSPFLTAALIYWIWIMIMGIRLHYPCPDECWCHADTHEIDCSNEGLQYIPENTLGELEELILDGNNYSVLRKDMLHNKAFSNIEHLSFNRCNVSVIEAGAFDHISVHLTLYLRDNNITDIPYGVFHNLTTLKTLNMSSNNIEVIRSKVFKGLESLTNMSVQNNSIRYFETDAFWGLFNLIALDLSSNKIIHMQSDLFSEMPRLYHLDLSGNMIDIPSHTELLNSDTLNIIDLHSCDITKLSENTFRNMTSLQGIALQSNRLTYVNPNTFSMLSNLSTVYLHNNPLICDCNLKETYSWFVEHNIDTGDIFPRCDEPSEVNGLWWEVVGSGECEDMVIKYNEVDKFVIHEYTDSMDEEDPYTRYKHYKKYSQLVRYLMFGFGTVGNVIIILIILCNKELRTIPNMYILSLASGDLLTLITGASASEFSPPSFHQYICRVSLYTRILSHGVTAYSVAILSIQRYEVIVRPFLSRVRNLNPRRTVAFHISSTWILASLFTLTAIYSKDKGQCIFIEMMKYLRQVVMLQFVVFCILPLCVIATMYILTASHLMRSKAVASEEIPQHQRQAKSRATTVKMILSLTLVFMITSVPFHTMWMYAVWFHSDYANDNKKRLFLFIWENLASCLYLSNACFNPVALLYASSAFRKCLKSILCSRREKKRNPPPVPAIQAISANL